MTYGNVGGELRESEPAVLAYPPSDVLLQFLADARAQGLSVPSELQASLGNVRQKGGGLCMRILSFFWVCGCWFSFWGCQVVRSLVVRRMRSLGCRRVLALPLVCLRLLCLSLWGLRLPHPCLCLCPWVFCSFGSLFRSPFLMLLMLVRPRPLVLVWVAPKPLLLMWSVSLWRMRESRWLRTKLVLLRPQLR